MLKLRFIGRGMNLESRHPTYPRIVVRDLHRSLQIRADVRCGTPAFHLS